MESDSLEKIKFSSSRRDFIKKGSVFTIGAVVLSGPVTSLFSSLLGEDEECILNSSLTCELYRFSDLLHLKFYFFNVNKEETVLKNKLIRKDPLLPVFLYVQLPSQHISEDLVQSISNINGRGDFKRKKSFLSNKSWIALKVNENNLEGVSTLEELRLKPDDLLAWEDNFSLVTLDDFLSKKFRSTTDLGNIQCLEYKEELRRIINTYNDKHNSTNGEY